MCLFDLDVHGLIDRALSLFEVRALRTVHLPCHEQVRMHQKLLGVGLRRISPGPEYISRFISNALVPPELLLLRANRAFPTIHRASRAPQRSRRSSRTQSIAPVRIDLCIRGHTSVNSYLNELESLARSPATSQPGPDVKRSNDVHQMLTSGKEHPGCGEWKRRERNAIRATDQPAWLVAQAKVSFATRAGPASRRTAGWEPSDRAAQSGGGRRATDLLYYYAPIWARQIFKSHFLAMVCKRNLNHHK